MIQTLVSSYISMDVCTLQKVAALIFRAKSKVWLKAFAQNCNSNICISIG